MASKKAVLRFPEKLIDQPIISRLVREHNLEFNILRASITALDEGLMVLELKGDQAECSKGLEFLKQLGVEVRPLDEVILRDEDRCTSCGVCHTVCPAGALVLNRETGATDFKQEECIGCELCIPACPPRAMLTRFNCK